ncbi:hypothetical protein GGX14DRAFT_462054, partial [Mycena pura]
MTIADPRFFWEFHLILVYVCFLSWVACIRGESPPCASFWTPIWNVSRLHQAVTGAYLSLSLCYLRMFHFLRILLSIHDNTPIARAALNRSARRRQARTRKSVPRLHASHTPVFPKSASFLPDVSLRSILDFLMQLSCDVRNNWRKPSFISAKYPVLNNRTAKRQRMLTNWRDVRRIDWTISWAVWKLVASTFRAFEKNGLPQTVGQKYTGYISVPLPADALHPRSRTPYTRFT